MSNELPTTLNNIFERYKKEAGDARISMIDFIKDLNDLLFEMPISKPAEQQANIYYLSDKDFIKYALFSDFGETIGLYSDNTKIIRYVSNLRFKLDDPINAYTDVSDNGKRFLKIRNILSNSNKVIVTDCSSLTADGTWANTGDAGTISIDTNTKKYGGGSIKFPIVGTQGIITFTKTNVIDASSFTEHTLERFFAWLPVAPTNIKIRYGNDSSNYFEQIVTTQASAETFDTENPNEIELRESEATQTGTVDKENIDWFQFEFNFASAVNNSNFRIDKLVLAKPEVLEHEYYTKYRAIDSDGNLKDKIDEDDSTTDEPIIKDYSDFINCIIDGLVASHLKNKAPDRSTRYREDYMAKRSSTTGKLIGGIDYLLQKYPYRRATYKRIKTLPSLNNFRSSRIYR